MVYFKKGKKDAKNQSMGCSVSTVSSASPGLSSPAVTESRAGGHAALLKTEVSLATCPKISCELNLFHGFAYGAAL